MLETRKALPVNPQQRKAIAYTVETFDAVQKLDETVKGKLMFKQTYGNLPAVNQDIKTFVKLAKQFRFDRDDIIVFK